MQCHSFDDDFKVKEKPNERLQPTESALYEIQSEMNKMSEIEKECNSQSEKENFFVHEDPEDAKMANAILLHPEMFNDIVIGLSEEMYNATAKNCEAFITVHWRRRTEESVLLEMIQNSSPGVKNDKSN